LLLSSTDILPPPAQLEFKQTTHHPDQIATMYKNILDSACAAQLAGTKADGETKIYDRTTSHEDRRLSTRHHSRMG
jgi:hypothetical protein